jgi:hypothetical protein
VLGVPRNADEEEIKRAYKKVALKIHPDKNTAPEAEAAFKKLGTVMSVLMDGNARAAYDQDGEQGVQRRAGGGGGGGGFAGGGFHRHGEVDPDEILRMFFGGGLHGFHGGGFRGGRVYTTNGGAGRGGGGGGGAGGAEAGGGTVNLLQLLPLLLFALMSLSSLFDSSGGGGGVGGGGGSGVSGLWVSAHECQAALQTNPQWAGSPCARVETASYNGGRVVPGVSYWVPHTKGRYLNSPRVASESWMREKWQYDVEASRLASSAWTAHRCGSLLTGALQREAAAAAAAAEDPAATPRAAASTSMGDAICDSLRGAFGGGR